MNAYEYIRSEYDSFRSALQAKGLHQVAFDKNEWNGLIAHYYAPKKDDKDKKEEPKGPNLENFLKGFKSLVHHSHPKSQEAVAEALADYLYAFNLAAAEIYKVLDPAVIQKHLQALTKDVEDQLQFLDRKQHQVFFDAFHTRLHVQEEAEKIFEGGGLIPVEGQDKPQLITWTEQFSDTKDPYPFNKMNKRERFAHSNDLYMHLLGPMLDLSSGEDKLIDALTQWLQDPDFYGNLTDCILLIEGHRSPETELTSHLNKGRFYKALHHALQEKRSHARGFIAHIEHYKQQWLTDKVNEVYKTKPSLDETSYYYTLPSHKQEMAGEKAEPSSYSKWIQGLSALVVLTLAILMFTGIGSPVAMMLGLAFLPLITSFATTVADGGFNYKNLKANAPAWITAGTVALAVVSTFLGLATAGILPLATTAIKSLSMGPMSTPTISVGMLVAMTLPLVTWVSGKISNWLFGNEAQKHQGHVREQVSFDKKIAQNRKEYKYIPLEEVKPSKKDKVKPDEDEEEEEEEDLKDKSKPAATK